MSEIDLQRTIQLELSSADIRLFRNNVGEAWQGGNFTIRDGRLVSGHARRVAYGLAVGSSDLIGPRSVIITPQMVGRRVALFGAIETKAKRGLTPEQRNFIDMVNSLGGCAGFARSIEDARLILEWAR